MPDVLPPFTDEGVLPPGDYEVTFDQLRASRLVTGPSTGSITGWNEEWRDYLTRQAELLCNQLWAEDIQDVFLDGHLWKPKAIPTISTGTLRAT